VADIRRGQAYDIGWDEGGTALLASPDNQIVDPGGEAYYALRLDRPDWALPLSLTATSPSPWLDVSLSSPIITAAEVVTLTVSDGHTEPTILPALTYVVPITATSPGFTATTSVRLAVGGARIYLPIDLKNGNGR
jgi:hypothetical protein